MCNKKVDSEYRVPHSKPKLFKFLDHCTLDRSK